MPACLQTFQFAAQLKTVLFRQNNVYHDALRTLFENFLDGFVTIDRGNHIKATIAQRRHNHRQLCPTIILNKDFLPRHLIIPFQSANSASVMGKKGYCTNASIPCPRDIDSTNPSHDVSGESAYLPAGEAYAPASSQDVS